MGEAPEIQLQIINVQEDKDPNLVDQTKDSSQPTVTQHRSYYKRWLLMAIYSFFLLAGQSAATLLGRLYYDKGGNSKWMATLVQPAGFPILIPLYYLSAYKTSTETSDNITNPPSVLVLSAMYVALGVLVASDCMLYSIGLFYLPVSTYSLICASQLAFNALFSFFLNKQKFTPFIINSIVLLTLSSTLLVFQNNSSGSASRVSKGKYVIGFVCTLAASAGYGFLLSVTQLCFQKILRKQTLKVVLDMLIYPALVGTLIILVGLFASRDWKSVDKEMEGFSLGKVSYVNILVWTAIAWQVFSIGAIGLILEVSSLFSNVISTLGLPIIPILAMIFFHDPMTGIKVISMLLAIWGFVSYVYQHYLDDRSSKTGKLQ